MDAVNDQFIYNATFSRKEAVNYEAIKWGTNLNYVTVTLDWDNTGRTVAHKLNDLKRG